MRIELLGAFAFRMDGGTVDPNLWSSRKVRALVALLALAPAQRLLRDELIEQLWPGLDVTAGAHNLHQALYLARRAVGVGASAGWLTVQQEQVVLCDRARVPVDVLEFQQAADRALAEGGEALLRSAAAAYSGDLLPDLASQEQFAARRSALASRHQTVIMRLAEELCGNGATQEALALFDEVLEADPLQEAAVRGSMRALAFDGRRSEALVRYDRLRKFLRDELGVDPDDHTQVLFHELLAEESAVSPPKESLPEPVTSFIGRDRELGDVDRLLARRRLVTLAGAGGSGKTRLGIEIGRRVRHSYSGGVWFVDLSGLAEPDLLPDVVATALDLIPGAGRDPVGALASQLGDRAVLIVLDNCEHLLTSCARLVTALLERCPRIKVLATSREPLRISGETTFRVPALELPGPADADLPVPAALGQVAAVKLFVDRATLARPDFRLQAANAAAVTEICRRLDGLPLALELASARVAVLEPSEIVDRLGDMLSVIDHRTSGISRHETLHAALAWSYDLLSPDEKRLLRGLSVFAGGFTMDAAEAVCGGLSLDTARILGVVASLVDKSLVIAEHSGTRTRYRLLETVRQFCSVELLATEGSSALAAAHCAHYRRTARTHDPERASGVVVENFAALDAEHDNFRAALRWALTADPPGALELAASLWRFWFLRCHVVEGGDWVERALAASPAPTTVRAKALFGLTGLNARRGRSDSVRSLSATAAAVMAQAGDPAEAAAYRLLHATMVWATFDVGEAEVIAGQVRTEARKLGRPELLAGSSWVLAQCALTREDPVTAGRLLERCLTELADARIGTAPFLPAVTPCSIVVPVQGRLVPSYEESLLLGRRVGAVQGVGLVLAAMGYAARLVGDLAAAGSVVGQAAQHFDVLGDDLGKAQALNQLGCVLRDAGDFARGADQLARAVAIRHRLGDRRGEWMARANLALLSARRGDIDEGRRAAQACLAAFQGVQDRPSIANAWATLANIELAGGDIRAARDLYGRAIAEFADQSWPRVEAWHRLVAAELCVELGDSGRAERELLQAQVLLERQRCAAARRRLDSVRASLD